MIEAPPPNACPPQQAHLSALMRDSTRAERLRMPFSRFTALVAPCTWPPLLHST